MDKLWDRHGSRNSGSNNGEGHEKPVNKRTRTRTGCLNCRRKKRRCDEGRPTCGTCCRRNEFCEWGLKITFRAGNARGIDETHPSMRSSLNIRSPRHFEIRDVTSDVIRDYNEPSPVSAPGDGIEMWGGQLRLPGVSNQQQQEGSSFLSPPSDMLSPSSQRHNEIAVANLIHFSQSNPDKPSPIDPLLHLSAAGSLPLEAMPGYSHADHLEDFTLEGMPEDGIFQPGTAYHELHSTLRNRLIQEVKSNAPTRHATPGPDDKGHQDNFTVNGDANDYDDETDAAVQKSSDFPLKDGQSPLLSDEEEYDLWKNWSEEIAPWVDKFDRHRHFQTIIPTMAKEHNHLRYSMLALSARQLERKDATLPTDRSLALYQQAIHLLLPQLPSRSTATIASCVILCVLEMLSCSPKAWRRHLDGCASLMQAVGIDGMVGGTEQALFWCFARMDVCGGLISSVQTLIPVANWASKISFEADVALFASSAEFEQWSNYAVYLLASVLQILAPLPDHTLQSPLRNDPKYRSRWLQLWERICDWYRSRPAPLLAMMTIPSSTSSPFPTILYSNPAAISGNQLHHTASILMLQNQPVGVKLASKPRSILWHARQICGISISNEHHGAWTNSIQPLWIAGKCMSHPSEHKAILELLDKIERESGWGTSWRADDLKEYWGDLSD